MLLNRRWLSLALAAVAVLAIACGSSDDKEDSGRDASSAGGLSAGAAATQAPQAQIKRGGTMIVALDNNPQHFDSKAYTDVFSSRVGNNVYDTLVRHDENLVPQPWLAEKIDRPDDITYVITLRKGVKFHDGTDLNAEAVKFSIDRIREFKTGPSYADSQYIADTVVVDPSTIKIVTTEPFSPFLGLLAGRIGTIVSPAAVRSMGEEKYSLNPVGTGPFKFVEWKNDAYVKVVRNDGYWKQGADGKALPYLDGIEFRIITEPAGRLTALQAGDVHVTTVRDPDMPIVKRDTNLTWKQQADFGWQSLLLSVTKPPFDNKALRQAVANALDRDEIIRVIYEGNAVPAQGPIGPAMPWARDEAYKPYDQNKVKDYLAAGGKPGGFEFTGWFSAGSSQQQQLAELIQAQLAKHGITMKVEFADFNGVVVPKARAKEPGAFAIGFSCGPDPDACVYNRFASDGSFNYMGYANPEADRMLKGERRSFNREERAKLFKDVNKLIVEEAPAVFTIHGVDRFVGNKKVQGWQLGYYLAGGSPGARNFGEFWLSAQ